MRNPSQPFFPMSLLIPPYEMFSPVREIAGFSAERGVALAWFLTDAEAQSRELHWLARRPANVSLIVVLPAPAGISRVLGVLKEVSALKPRGVLPNSGVNSLESMRLLLGSAPRDIPAVVVGHLADRGVLRTQRGRSLIHKVFELAPTVPSISKLSRKLYTSRRTLGRYFEAEGLPVPSHWLQFARLIHVSALIQEKQDLPIFKAALQVGYPDGFTMSNQMKRLIGCRPTDVRECLGLNWIIEEWVQRERAEGGLRVASAVAQQAVNDWLYESPVRRIF